MNLKEKFMGDLKNIFNLFLEVLAEDAPVSPVVEAELAEINRRHVVRVGALCDDYDEQLQVVSERYEDEARAVLSALRNKLGDNLEEFAGMLRQGVEVETAKARALEKARQQRSEAREEAARIQMELDRSIEGLSREWAAKAEVILREAEAECNQLLLSAGLAELTFRGTDPN
ncbi:MAG: hypothetical protein V2A55_01335 [Candidatus Jorgensenbacteria bacterium]